MSSVLTSPSGPAGTVASARRHLSGASSGSRNLRVATLVVPFLLGAALLVLFRGIDNVIHRQLILALCVILLAVGTQLASPGIRVQRSVLDDQPHAK